LANAYFRLAYNANRFFDFDRAVENYMHIADSQRFARSTDPTIDEKRDDALINAAIILDRQQQYARATEYYRRAAESISDDAAKLNAYYRIAEMQFSQNNWTGTIREMRAFITRYQGNRDAGELVVQAHWRIAQATENARSPASRQREALQDVVNAFSRSGQEPGSMAAEYAAHAKFRLVDGAIDGFEDFAIRPGRPATMQAYVNTITTQIDAGAREAQSIKDGYEPVLGYRRPAWTIASFVRQGRAYEILARAVLNTPFVTPNDLAAQMRRLPPEARDQIALEIEGTVQGTLDTRTRPIECLAVSRYALAARASRAGNINNEYTQVATDRLQSYGEERIAECLAEAQRTDASFQAYTAGEFARAPRGRNIPMQADTSPPSLSNTDSR
jgi:tetratricopeptide (TPR) repeat protein